MRVIYSLFLIILFSGCNNPKQEEEKQPTPEFTTQTMPFTWENATIYFLLTDRFANGDPTNDLAYNRKHDGALLRSFEGGDFKGISQKIDEGYFDQLGVNALWMTPVFEQIHGSTDEGTGMTYAYHGYWIRDWTAVDANFGSREDFKALVDKAHEHGIRVLMDVVINHTGPVTDIDSQWPDDWVRMGPVCDFKNYKGTVECTLVKNLPDIKTESNQAVELPVFLVNKWKAEGRLEQEVRELNSFFDRTGYPRSPRYYIIKWLVDYILEFGIDGFRVDTAKHTEPSVWADLFKEANAALKIWKGNHPAEKLDDLDFYMVGEVYGYNIADGQLYHMSDSTFNYFKNGFKSLINFAFKDDARKNMDQLFRNYSRILTSGALRSKSVLNYVSSHDDGNPYDINREHVLDAATRLLLAPGAAQIYYGDETGRPLKVKGANGDANLRSNMNWKDLKNNVEINGHSTSDIFSYWSKLGRFRNEHPSVGAGKHRKLTSSPYTFMRTWKKDSLIDRVVVVLGHHRQPVNVKGIFAEGQLLKDYFSGKQWVVKKGKVAVKQGNEPILLGVPANR